MVVNGLKSSSEYIHGGELNGPKVRWRNVRNNSMYQSVRLGMDKNHADVVRMFAEFCYQSYREVPIDHVWTSDTYRLMMIRRHCLNVTTVKCCVVKGGGRSCQA